MMALTGGLALVAALAGLPLFLVIGGLTIVGFLVLDAEPALLFIEMARLSTQETLVAVPIFTFAGYVLAESKAPARVVRVARAALGWLPGGVAFVSVGACALFTAFTGASGVTIIALGGLLYPVLLDEGLPERFSLGLLTSGGSLGLLFPPSLPVILYAVVAGVNYEALFRAALLPGLLLLAVLGMYAAWVAARSGARRQPFSGTELLQAGASASWDLSIPGIVVAGIYGGVMLVDEAAVFTALAVVVVNVFIHRDLSPRDVLRVGADSAVLVGAILLIFGVALGLTNVLVLAFVPDLILEWLQSVVSSRWAFLLGLNLFLLAVGCLLDVFSAIIVVVPLLLPLLEAYQVHPLHLGVVFLTNLEIGYVTPPVGMNLFLSAFRFEKPLPEVYRATLPFIALLLGALAVITFVPALSV
ncbi:MAG: TRAP transporter large permease subunit [Myxococcota bacterium]